METPNIIATESTRNDFMDIGKEFKLGKRKFVCVNHWTAQTIMARRVDKVDGADYFFTLDELPSGRAAYGAEYRKMRKLAVELAFGVCSICGADRDLDVHHIDNNPKNNSIENLKVLCVTCHTNQKGHEHYKKAAKYRLLWHK